MPWLILMGAGLFEIGWAVGLKYTDGFTRLWPTLATVVSMAISLGLLGLALRTLPLGTAYAVWTGIGPLGTVIVGILWLGDSADALRLVFLPLHFSGTVCLKFPTSHRPTPDAPQLGQPCVI